MRSLVMKCFTPLMLCLACACAAHAAETVDPNAGKPTAIAVNAADANVREMIEAVAGASREKIVMESTVKGKLTASYNGQSVEDALSVLCKAAKIEWRKVYVSADSNLIDQPDKFASTVRLMSGLSFPDMVLAGSSIGKVGAHLENKAGVKVAEDAALKSLGMVKVYLVTNDAAIAAKAQAEKDKPDKTRADKYVDTQKKLLDDFMEMSPEEREQVIMRSLDLMDQIDSGYMAAAMEAVVKVNPEFLKQKLGKQNEMLYNMSTDTRRAMIRMGIEMQSTMPTDLRELMAEDTKAVMEEMGIGPGQH